jgi:hypothetical protein
MTLALFTVDGLTYGMTLPMALEKQALCARGEVRIIE